MKSQLNHDVLKAHSEGSSFPPLPAMGLCASGIMEGI